MKVLYIIPYTPVNPTFGGSLRIYHILDHLCRHHDVTVAGFSIPEDEKRLVKNFPQLAGKTHFIKSPALGKSARWVQFKSLFTSHSYWHQSTRSEAFQTLLDKLLKVNSFDIIQCEFPSLAMYRYESDAIKIIDCHNVEFDNFRRMAKVKNPLKKMYYRLESYKFYQEETAICKKQDALFVTSDRDISIFDEEVPEVPKYLVPNGVDASYFLPSKTTPKPYSMIFVGMMKYVPNYDGMIYFLDEIFPRIQEQFPEATITIIGKNPPTSITRRAGKNVIVTGFVEDTRPYIENASVYVVPLRMGGGTRLKIIEALSMKKPLVTTSIGCEGIDIENKESALIADDPQEFADAVMKLFSNKELCKKLTDSGYKIVIDKYRWKSIGNHIDLAYEELIESKLNRVEKEAHHYATNGII